MYASKIAAAVLALAGSSTAAKVCDTATSLCYNEFVQNGIRFRIAIPDTATNTAAYDIALSIIAPVKVGWAAIAWGGSMTNNPLTLGWSNGTGAIASSKRASMRVMPTAYPGATLVVLPNSYTNATHWKLDALCTGCSTWTGANNAKSQINPTGAAVSLAWASAAMKPTTPTNKDSNIAKHDAKGVQMFSFSDAKLANFTALVDGYKTGGTSSSLLL